jgi:FK506-binding protein 1
MSSTLAEPRLDKNEKELAAELPKQDGASVRRKRRRRSRSRSSSDEDTSEKRQTSTRRRRSSKRGENDKETSDRKATSKRSRSPSSDSSSSSNESDRNTSRSRRRSRSRSRHRSRSRSRSRSASDDADRAERKKRRKRERREKERKEKERRRRKKVERRERRAKEEEAEATAKASTETDPSEGVVVLDSKRAIALVAKNSVGMVEKQLVREGKAGTRPVRGQRVTVHATGYLLPGMKQFWTTRKTADNKYSTPFVFEIGDTKMIQGWELGVCVMCLGERARITISGNYGYGVEGHQAFAIPPYATLCYDIEILRID